MNRVILRLLLGVTLYALLFGCSNEGTVNEPLKATVELPDSSLVDTMGVDFSALSSLDPASITGSKVLTLLKQCKTKYQLRQLQTVLKSVKRSYKAESVILYRFGNHKGWRGYYRDHKTRNEPIIGSGSLSVAGVERYLSGLVLYYTHNGRRASMDGRPMMLGDYVIYAGDWDQYGSSFWDHGADGGFVYLWELQDGNQLVFLYGTGTSGASPQQARAILSRVRAKSRRT